MHVGKADASAFRRRGGRELVSLPCRMVLPAEGCCRWGDDRVVVLVFCCWDAACLSAGVGYLTFAPPVHALRERGGVGWSMVVVLRGNATDLARRGYDGVAFIGGSGRSAGLGGKVVHETSQGVVDGANVRLGVVVLLL